MADLGKVKITDEGNYSSSTTYEELTFVHYQGDAYMTLKTVKGVTPTDDGINYRLFCKSAELATALKAGIVLPDGTTIEVDSNGVISAKIATNSAAGIVKPASTDFAVAADGAMKIKTAFSKAATLAALAANEAWLTLLGKLATAVDELIALKSNALLKSAISDIAVNDRNKVNSAAYIYALAQRLGIAEELTAGANLTAVANKLNSDITSKADRSDLSTSTGWTKEFTFKASSVSGSIYQIAVSGTTIGLLIGHVSGGNVTLNWAYKNNDNVTVQVAGLNIKLSSTSDFVAAVTTLRK